MAKKKKQKIKIYFRDGKKDIIPQKFWTDYDFIAKDSGTYFVVIKYDGQNQNVSPYNNYGRMNYNPLNNGMSMKNLPHYEVIRVNGRAGA